MISMAIFNSKLLVYQRVSSICLEPTSIGMPGTSVKGTKRLDSTTSGLNGKSMDLLGGRTNEAIEIEGISLYIGLR